MKRKISLVIFLPLLVGLVVLGACSSGKSDKVYGYTYDELEKIEDLSDNGNINEVQKYETNGETRYMIISDDSKDYPKDPDTIYMSFPSDYIEQHKISKTDHYIYGRDQDKPDVGKVIESYKVDAKNKTFEKENN